MQPQPSFYLDENLEIELAVRLKASGFDVVTARDAGMLGRSDEEHLAFAAESGRVILTHDIADFVSLSQEWAQTGAATREFSSASTGPPRKCFAA